jgi:small subunit ribosomal protein S6
MFILNPELDEETTQGLTDRIRGYLEEGNATIFKTEDLGLRRMAYAIQGHRQGHYYLVQFAMDTEAIRELERRLLLTEGVMRELIVRMETEPERQAAPPPSETESAA